jgi:hypothetical protein
MSDVVSFHDWFDQFRNALRFLTAGTIQYRRTVKARRRAGVKIKIWEAHNEADHVWYSARRVLSMTSRLRDSERKFYLGAQLSMILGTVEQLLVNMPSQHVRGVVEDPGTEDLLTYVRWLVRNSHIRGLVKACRCLRREYSDMHKRAVPYWSGDIDEGTDEAEDVQTLEMDRPTQQQAGPPPVDEPGALERFSDLVTLAQVAAAVHKSKRTLEDRKTKGTLPEPVVEGGGGKTALYDWKVMRPWLEREFGMILPERFPGNAR